MNGVFIDLTGQKFGRLTVIERDYSKYYTSWLCRCSCGNLKIIQGCNLKSKVTTSCGCYRNEIVSKISIVHGLSKTKIYNIWKSMKARCYNKNNPKYKIYGERGIKICDHWLESFENFYKDMGDIPKGLTLDRINNDGNYTLENCKWSTKIEQQNNKRNNIFYKYKGESLTLSQLSRKYSINRETLRKRIKKMSIDKAIETPVREYICI